MPHQAICGGNGPHILSETATGVGVRNALLQEDDVSGEGRGCLRACQLSESQRCVCVCVWGGGGGLPAI